MLQDYKEVISEISVGWVDVKRGYREDGSRCGRILSVRCLCVYPRSALTWAVETNIMVGTHADSLIAEAVVKGITGFDTELAYEAVRKDGTVPPANDNTTE